MHIGKILISAPSDILYFFSPLLENVMFLFLLKNKTSLIHHHHKNKGIADVRLYTLITNWSPINCEPKLNLAKNSYSWKSYKNFTKVKNKCYLLSRLMLTAHNFIWMVPRHLHQWCGPFYTSWSLMKKASYLHRVTAGEEEAQRRGCFAL